MDDKIATDVDDVEFPEILTEEPVHRRFREYDLRVRTERRRDAECGSVFYHQGIATGSGRLRRACNEDLCAHLDGNLRKVGE